MLYNMNYPKISQHFKRILCIKILILSAYTESEACNFKKFNMS